jgi:hypothetical protein
MSEQPIGFPEGAGEGVEGDASGEEFMGELGEREVGDTAFSGEFEEREHEGRENISRESDAEVPPLG